MAVKGIVVIGQRIHALGGAVRTTLQDRFFAAGHRTQDRGAADHRRVGAADLTASSA